MLVLKTAFYGVCTEPQACLNTARKRPSSSHTATGSWALLFRRWGGLRALVNSVSESQATSLPTAFNPMPPKGEVVLFPDRLRKRCGATRKQMSWVSLHPAVRPRSFTHLCHAPSPQEWAWLQPACWSLPSPSAPPPDCTLADGPAKCCPRSLDSAFWRGGPVPASHHLGKHVHR